MGGVRTRTLRALGMVTVALAAASCSGGEGQQPQQGAPGAGGPGGGPGRGSVGRTNAVEVQPVVRGSIARQVTVSGVIEPVRTVGVNSQLAGAVTTVNVQESDIVREGAVLARMDDRELAAQLASAEASYQVADASYQRAEQLRERKVITLPEYERERTAFAAAKAQVEQLRTRIGYATVRAPASGVITEKRVEAGDLVYNRLTDFTFDEPAHTAMRQAWLDDAAVVTPHPRAHALYADKRNLVALCDEALLAAWGIDAATRALLAEGIPRTELVVAGRADDFWARRKQLFFKPAAGYGSKAAYRGDKMTKGVFAEIVGGLATAPYIAQALVPPSSRHVDVGGAAVELKLDLRTYVYDSRVQLVAARLWQGQTTNFRTPGGGFAPVLAVPPGSLA
jgi:biotin carboxyl carrier protein